MLKATHPGECRRSNTASTTAHPMRKIRMNSHRSSIHRSVLPTVLATSIAFAFALGLPAHAQSRYPASSGSTGGPQYKSNPAGPGRSGATDGHAQYQYGGVSGSPPASSQQAGSIGSAHPAQATNADLGRNNGQSRNGVGSGTATRDKNGFQSQQNNKNATGVGATNRFNDTGFHGPSPSAGANPYANDHGSTGGGAADQGRPNLPGGGMGGAADAPKQPTGRSNAGGGADGSKYGEDLNGMNSDWGHPPDGYDSQGNLWAKGKLQNGFAPDPDDSNRQIQYRNGKDVSIKTYKEKNKDGGTGDRPDNSGGSGTLVGPGGHVTNPGQPAGQDAGGGQGDRGNTPGNNTTQHRSGSGQLYHAGKRGQNDAPIVPKDVGTLDSHKQNKGNIDPKLGGTNVGH